MYTVIVGAQKLLTFEYCALVSTHTNRLAECVVRNVLHWLGHLGRPAYD